MPDKPQLPDVIQRAIDATNAGDTDAFVACFTDDAYVNDYGRDFHGHDGVRSWDSTDNVGVHMHFDVTGAEHTATAGPST